MHKQGCCVKCGVPATYNSPASYCTYHWVEWWVNGMGITDRKEREAYMQELLDDMREQDRE